MKPQLLVSMLFLWCLPIIAHPALNKREEMNLKGRVKTLKSWGRYEAVFFVHFDENGFLTKLESKGKQGMEERTNSYTKDEQGRIVRISEVNSRGAETGFKEIVYEPILTVTIKDLTSNESQIQYWDSLDRCTIMKQFKDDELIGYKTYNYNDKGQWKKIENYAADFKLHTYSKYQYDDLGNPTEITLYGIYGKLLEEQNISYHNDPHGNYTFKEVLPVEVYQPRNAVYGDIEYYPDSQ